MFWQTNLSLEVRNAIVWTLVGYDLGGHISATPYDYMNWENQREFYARETSWEETSGSHLRARGCALANINITPLGPTYRRGFLCGVHVSLQTSIGKSSYIISRLRYNSYILTLPWCRRPYVIVFDERSIIFFSERNSLYFLSRLFCKRVAKINNKIYKFLIMSLIILLRQIKFSYS